MNKHSRLLLCLALAALATSCTFYRVKDVDGKVLAGQGDQGQDRQRADGGRHRRRWPCRGYARTRSCGVLRIGRQVTRAYQVVPVMLLNSDPNSAQDAAVLDPALQDDVVEEVVVGRRILVASMDVGDGIFWMGILSTARSAGGYHRRAGEPASVPAEIAVA